MKNPLLLLLFLAALVGLSSGPALAEKRFVYSSAGGAVTVYRVDVETGKLKEIQSNPGTGLTAISSDQRFLYRVGGGEIESYRIRKNGTLKSIGKSETPEKAGYLALDAKFLYVSNRDLTDRKAVTGDSSIVGFEVDPETQLLEKIGHTPCPQVPRSFAIDRAGEFVHVAGQTAAKLATYRLDQETGALALVEEIDTGTGPNWVKCLTIPE